MAKVRPKRRENLNATRSASCLFLLEACGSLNSGTYGAKHVEEITKENEEHDTKYHYVE